MITSHHSGSGGGGRRGQGTARRPGPFFEGALCACLFSLALFLLPSCSHLKGKAAESLAAAAAPQEAGASPPTGEKDSGGDGGLLGLPSGPQGAQQQSGERFQDVPAFKAEATGVEVAAAARLPFSEKRKVTVAVNAMPLVDFVHYLFGEVFEVSYVVHQEVEKLKQPVTLNLKEAVSEARLFRLAQEVLAQQKVVVFLKEGVFYVWSAEEVKDVRVGIGASPEDMPEGAGEVYQLVPLRYAEPANVIQFVQDALGLKAKVHAEESLVTLKGPRELVAQALEALRLLDRPAMRGRFVSLVSLSFWEPEEFLTSLQEVLKEEGIPVSTSAGSAGIFFSPLERLKGFLAFAAEPAWLERTKHWVRLLDVPMAGTRRQYFIYYPENAKAVELGESLGQILALAEERAAFAPAQAAPAPVAPQPKAPAPRRTTETEGRTGQAELAASPSAQVAKKVAGAFEDLSFSVDETRNAIVFYATAERYQEARALLTKLDIVPSQVVLEVQIAEVTLTDSLKYGIEWYMKGQWGNNEQVLKTKGGLGSLPGGLAYSIVRNTGSFEFMLQALAKDDLIKVLSNPRLTVRDGKSATINVGDEVPTVTAETTSADVQQVGGIIRSVQYRKTGIILTVTPTVNARGIVTLEIDQEVSQALENKLTNIDSPTIRNRAVKTEVVTGDAQTVVLAGLIRESENRTVNKVPLLGDLPVLGQFFRNTSKDSDRTELVVMITPRIIRSADQIDRIREELLRSFEYLTPAGGAKTGEDGRSGG